MPVTLMLTFSDNDETRIAALAASRNAGSAEDYVRAETLSLLSKVAVSVEKQEAEQDALRAALDAIQPLSVVALKDELAELEKEVAGYRGYVGSDAEEAREREIDARIAEIKQQLASGA